MLALETNLVGAGKSEQATSLFSVCAHSDIGKQDMPPRLTGALSCPIKDLSSNNLVLSISTSCECKAMPAKGLRLESPGQTAGGV